MSPGSSATRQLGQIRKLTSRVEVEERRKEQKIKGQAEAGSGLEAWGFGV